MPSGALRSTTTARAARPAVGIDGRLAFRLGIALAALTLVAFARLAGNDFIDVDDKIYIRDNPRIRAGLSWDAIVWAFSGPRIANWHPITLLSHMLDCQLFGLNAAGHHLMSLAMHLASTLLLYRILLWTTKQPWPSAFAAAVFAIHPLHVESVAWAAERKDVLSTLFWLLATLAYVRWTAEPKVGRYLAVAVFFALGLFSKSMVVTLPFTLLLLDAWPLRRLSSPRDLGRLVVEKLPLFALSAWASWLAFAAQHGAGAVDMGHHPRSLGFRAQHVVVSYATYLWKTIAPADLVLQVPFPESYSVTQVAGSAAILLALTIVALAQLRARPWLAVGWFWFLGTLVPVIGLVQVGEQARADRFTYVPMIGLGIAAAFGAAEIARRSAAAKQAVAALGVLALVCWTIMTWIQVGYWKDDRALFTHVAAIVPEHDIARGALGNLAYREGRYADAIVEYEAARRANPHYAQWSNNLGMALARMGRFDEAKARYEEALREQPNLADAHHNLGFVQAVQGRMPEAIAHFEAALQANPDLPEVHLNLGIALMKTGQRDAAIAHFSRALELQPDNAQARSALEAARAGKGGT